MHTQSAIKMRPKRLCAIRTTKKIEIKADFITHQMRFRTALKEPIRLFLCHLVLGRRRSCIFILSRCMRLIVCCFALLIVCYRHFHVVCWNRPQCIWPYAVSAMSMRTSSHRTWQLVTVDYCDPNWITHFTHLLALYEYELEHALATICRSTQWKQKHI